MVNEPTSTVRARRLRERRSRGIATVAPVEVGEGGYGTAMAGPFVHPYKFIAAAIVDNDAIRIIYGVKYAAIGRYCFRIGFEFELDWLWRVAVGFNRQAGRQPSGYSTVQYMYISMVKILRQPESPRHAHIGKLSGKYDGIGIPYPSPTQHVCPHTREGT